MKTIKIGLLGLGNIGTGTYKTLEMNRYEIESTLNAKVEIVKILERDTERDRGITVPNEKFTPILTKFSGSRNRHRDRAAGRDRTCHNVHAFRSEKR